jgi:hypothetical protein
MLSTIDVLIRRKDSHKMGLRGPVLVPTKSTSPQTTLPPETHLTGEK